MPSPVALSALIVLALTLLGNFDALYLSTVDPLSVLDWSSGTRWLSGHQSPLVA